MNVLYIVGKLNFGGVEKWLLEICKRNKKNKIFLWSNCDGNYIGKLENEFLNQNCTLIKENISKNLFINFLQMRKICKEYKIDVVHMHQHNFNGVLTFSAYLCLIKKRIVHFHSMKKNRNGFLYKIYEKIMLWLANNFSTHRIAVSDNVGKTQLKNYIVMPCGFTLAPLDHNKRIECMSKKIIQVGRFVSEKNYFFTIDLMNYIVKIDPDYKLYIVGDGNLRKEIENKIEIHNLKNNVEILGFCNNVNEILEKFNGLMVFPSLSEGLGLVSLEAQMNGCFCICSQNIPKEVNIGGAFFVEDYSYEKWFMAIKSCYKSISKINMNIEKFDIEDNLNFLEEIYTYERING